MLTQLLQPFEQTTRFLLDLLYMSLVDYLKPLKGVRLVLFAEHGTVAAYGFTACVTVVIESCIM